MPCEFRITYLKNGVTSSFEINSLVEDEGGQGGRLYPPSSSVGEFISFEHSL